VNRRSRTWGLEISLEPVTGGIVLAPKGRIGSVTAAAFEEAITSALATAPRLIIDLSGVDYISGPGVEVLRLAAITDGKRTILCGLHDAVRVTLELGGVLEGIPVLKSLQEAVELP
jgi:anti-anti-sigma factor